MPNKADALVAVEPNKLHVLLRGATLNQVRPIKNTINRVSGAAPQLAGEERIDLIVNACPAKMSISAWITAAQSKGSTPDVLAPVLDPSSLPGALRAAFDQLFTRQTLLVSLERHRQRRLTANNVVSPAPAQAADIIPRLCVTHLSSMPFAKRHGSGERL